MLALDKNLNVSLVYTDKESQVDLDFEDVTSACWHPRNDSLLLLGFQNGTVLLYDVVKGEEKLVFDRKKKV